MKPSTMKFQLAMSVALLLCATSAHAVKANPERNVYFGDTHAHSELSGDAYGFGNRLPPENAYRLARGEEVDHVGGYKVKLKAPTTSPSPTTATSATGACSNWSIPGVRPSTPPTPSGVT